MSDMRSIYSKRVEKLILGQKNGSKPSSRSGTARTGKPPNSRPSTTSRSVTPVGKGVSQPGTKPLKPPSSGLTFQDSIDASVSMLRYVRHSRMRILCVLLFIVVLRHLHPYIP